MSEKKTFEVWMAREATEYALITVEAKDAEEAEDLAWDEAMNDSNIEWELGDDREKPYATGDTQEVEE